MAHDSTPTRELATAPSRPGGTPRDGRSAEVTRWIPEAVSVLGVTAAVVALVTYAVVTGLPLRSALLGGGAIVLTQLVPGALAWRAVRPRNGWLLEDLAGGFALGSAVAVPTQIIAGLLHQRWLALAIPVVLAGALVAVPVTRRRILEARWTPTPWWFGTSIGLVSLVGLRQLVPYFTDNRVSYAVPTAPHVDTYLHQALATELLNRGPVAWPTVLGEDLGYHWFTHAWLAQITASSGVELNEVLVRLMPALMPVAVALAVGITGLRLGRRPWVGVLAAVVTILGGRFNPFGIPEVAFPMMPESPTLALGAPTLLLLVTVLALRWRGETLTGAWVLVPLLGVVSAGTKGSTAPLVVAGLGLAALAMLVWNRSMLARTVVDLAVVAAALVFAVIFVFHGSSAGLAFGVTNSAKQTTLADWLHALPSLPLVLLASGTAILGGLSRASLSVVLPFFSDTRREPLSWLLIGASAAGAAALGTFSHPGRSQGYFTLTAIPLAALATALGAQRLVTAFRGRFLVAVGAVGVAGGLAAFFTTRLVVGLIPSRAFRKAWEAAGTTGLVLVSVFVAAAVAGAILGVARWRDPDRVGTRWGGALTAGCVAVALALLVGGGTGATSGILAAGPPPNAPTTLRSTNAVSQGQIDVARYIRDHSGVDDLVMTNRHCTVPRQPFGGCDSRRWIVTAFSERQSLVEGWTATPEATRRAPHGRDSVTADYWKPDILRLNDDFYTAPSAEAWRRLWALGVRWVYVENTMPHASSLEPYADERFHTADASAWQLRAPTP